jgi:hypothetical protein
MRTSSTPQIPPLRYAPLGMKQYFAFPNKFVIPTGGVMGLQPTTSTQLSPEGTG